ncbi:hypothetical protein ACFFMN_15940 [Planobispora siamensis]|uniref:Uncharacterized protein n=1 Tax=Planobispora siamensis TaxID=936338 RepID=A0A8J3WLR3_9ACTN|nr:hypothetical protein [Planobispora siamensis]GIH93890.1 hypothetical protein Psi01_45200 [Planobispora siamensis]
MTVREGERLSDILKRLSKATGKPVREFEQAVEKGEVHGLPEPRGRVTRPSVLGRDAVRCGVGASACQA